MRECVVGRLGNVSETGMLMLASVPLREDALYQLRFPLPLGDGRQQAIDGACICYGASPRTYQGRADRLPLPHPVTRASAAAAAVVGEDGDEGPVSTA